MFVHFVVDARMGSDVVLASGPLLSLALPAFWVQFHNQFAQAPLSVLLHLINSIKSRLRFAFN